MEPVTLAVVTSSVVVLASKVIDGVASEAGKTLWNKIQKLLGFKKVPSPEDIAHQVAQRLKDDTELVSQILKEIKATPDELAGKIIHRIDADKVIYIGQQAIEGDVTFEL